MLLDTRRPAKSLTSLKIARLSRKVRDISRQSNQGRLSCLVDLAKCTVLYGIGLYEYSLYEFYNLSPGLRKTYHTSAANHKMVRRLNDISQLHLLRDKGLFLKRFRGYMKRDCLDLREARYEDFEIFFRKHKKFIAKAYDQAGGRQIQVYENLTGDPREHYDLLIKNHMGIIEEFVQQHAAISEIYAESVNTILISTLNTNGLVEVINYPSIRFGSSGGKIDWEGALKALIDKDTGCIITGAVSPYNDYYDVHPQSQAAFAGCQIPFFREAVELVKQAAREIPEIRYIGWDVAITEDGPVIIEGNGAPGFQQTQKLIALMNDGHGAREFYQNIV